MLCRDCGTCFYSIRSSLLLELPENNVGICFDPIKLRKWNVRRRYGLHDLCVCITAIVHKSNKSKRDGQQHWTLPRLLLWTLCGRDSCVIIWLFCVQTKLCARCALKNFSSISTTSAIRSIRLCIARKFFRLLPLSVRLCDASTEYVFIAGVCRVSFICDKNVTKAPDFPCRTPAALYESRINKCFNLVFVSFFSFIYLFYWTNDKIIPATLVMPASLMYRLCLQCFPDVFK